ncbi:conserved oligomeric Golgi complex subunit 2 [Diachasma alloeum]|uniref:conserved oligomeric Golgi complex subunit 2 n=1 Tax=Diachasma alloeum TaxID=454923 RepID=UPI0007383616|nr:conserved oligomeric Golgi complex subunit 2 [Diachasma alloeum]
MSKPPEFALPRAPEELSFKSSDFIAPDFDVDNFLHDHRKLATLETMRDDLGVYLKILRSAMIELINKDYADFVNLSKDLIGLDKAIDHLESPLGQIREEVLQIRQTLEAATVEMSEGLREHRRIREEKQCMHSLGRVYKSLTKLRVMLGGGGDRQHQLDRLERAATEYNQLKFHSSRCRQYLSAEVEANVQELEDALMTTLSDQLVGILQEGEGAEGRLGRCLRVYLSLGRVGEAEDLVRRRIVGPAVEDVIVEKNIYNEPRGLQGLYDKLLEVLSGGMKGLIAIEGSLEAHQGRGFNFVVNSYWIEVEEKIELRLKSIFAAGNPDLFHQRYKETLDYLKRMESHCSSPRILSELRAHPLYLQFLKKWNLPVYFQIRFQEIAGSVEQTLGQSASPGVMKPRGSPDEFTLKPTEVAWRCLERCWSDGIFLPQLLHQFWKLNLQICSRFRVWVGGSLRQTWIWSNEGTTQGTPGAPSRLEFLVYLHSDVMKFEGKLEKLLAFAEEKLGSLVCSVEEVLRASVEEMRAGLRADLPGISEQIVRELLGKSLECLKQVSDIPRLFRRTMRERPTQACAYVRTAVGGLKEFREMYQGVGQQVVDQWMLMALSRLAEQYFVSVKDVLESVQKTEESLRRLKKIRDKSSGAPQPETQGITDDEKIRVQLEIDVHTFCDSVKSFNIDVSSIEKLEELRLIVEAAVKNRS